MTNSNNKFTENPQSVEDFLNFAGFQLNKFPNPKIESEMLLSFALEKERVWLKTHADYILTDKESEKSREIIEKRKNNIPLAYIRGWKMWCNMKIEVSPEVLIPRDETEILANYILENSRNLEVKTILDIGTGSGCLAIFCGKRFPNAEITAIDISPEALSIAKENSKTHNVKIKFIESDLLDEVPAKNFDIIIANLPYVPTDIEITEDVKKEPYDAIFSGEDGLDLIRKLAEQLKSRCAPQGGGEISFHELWLEFWTAQESEIKNIFADYDVEFFPDFSGDTYFAKISPKE